MPATITCLVAREHINDLSREAEQSRRVRELPRPRRHFTVPRVFARRAPGSAAA